LLYGKRLPEVGRSVGQTLGELRRQWASLSRDLDVAAHIEGRAPASPKPRFRDEDPSGAATTRFDPPS
ncbi:MAG: twin-arginine translocase TatA/TatE family subunit, partial [Planctomycetia bacterium]